MRALFVALIVAAAVFSAKAAWAPPMVAQELAAQRAMGWKPCEPVISQLPSGPDLLADAATPGDPGVFCEIRFSVDIKAEQLDWVAWHEVCHLSTGIDIHADPAHLQYEDPAHQHPLFTSCIDQGPTERGQY